MKVIVLMAGEGQRFREAGYKESKPFIDVLGKPMVQRTTESLPFLKDVPAKNWWFAIRAEDYFNVKNMEILKRIYGEEINSVMFHKTTRGSLETAFQTAKQMEWGDENARFDDLLILDCDNVFDGEGFDQFLRTLNVDRKPFGAVCHFKPIDDTNHWCFAMKDWQNNEVEAIEERSDLLRESGADPMMGVFYFSSVNLFCSIADSIIKSSDKVAGEFYMSQAMKMLIKREFPVYGFEVTEPEPIGTPEYLEEYKMRRVRKEFVEFREAKESMKIKTSWTVDQKQDESFMERYKKETQLRICIDIDGTINHTKSCWDEYGHELPQDMAAATIREWKKQGHYIILYSARHMKTCNGNVGKIIARVAKATVDWLEKYNIPYDELHFGKPYADIYIDDRAYCHHNWLDTQKVVDDFKKYKGEK